MICRILFSTNLAVISRFFFVRREFDIRGLLGSSLRIKEWDF